MKLTKDIKVIITRQDIHDALFEYGDFLNDEISNMVWEYHNWLLKNPEPEDDTSKEFDIWINKSIDLQEKHRKIILNEIVELLSQYED